jgi:hypothetical protein
MASPKSYKDPYWRDIAEKAGKNAGLPDGLLVSIITKGERSNADQVSEAGAKTPFQIIPATRNAAIKKWGIDPYLSDENAAEVAALLLKESLDRNRGDVREAVGEYHGGTNRDNWGSRTKAYIGRVTGGQSTYERLKAQKAEPQQPDINSVLDAYKAGKMSKEDAAQFEQDVQSGAVVLPRGQMIGNAKPAGNVLPAGVIDAYAKGLMTPEEMQQVRDDVASGVAKLPTGVTLGSSMMVSRIPGAVEGASEITRTPEPTLTEKAIGAGEAGLSVIGAIPSSVGAAGGLVKGIAESAAAGKFGTPEGGAIVDKAVQQGADALTFFQPTTPEGQRMAGKVAEAMQVLPPVLNLPIGRAMAPAKIAAADTTRALSAQAAQKAQPAVQAVQNVAQSMADKVRPSASVARESVGAAATPQALERVATAEMMPVPFRGESALMEGQATRDQGLQQFEKETAKIPDTGRLIRERVMNQSETVVQNFEALADAANPTSMDNITIGKDVDRAVANKARLANQQIGVAYQKARDAGELEAPVNLDGLAARFAELDSQKGLVKTLDVFEKEANRLGIFAVDESGNLVTRDTNVNTAETMRQVIGSLTDWTDRQQARVAKILQGAIDDATEGVAGENYRRARALRRQYGQEFERASLTRKLLNAKKGTDERQIAVEDIYDRVVVRSSLEEMNKLRSTLISAGPEGKQAWANIKARTIDQIKESALSLSQSDERGNPLMSPQALNKAIARLDQDGKLESMFGKRQAQTIRDLGEIANVIFTSPPGAVNHSNTASALRIALDSFATFAATGVPAPAVTALKEAAKYVQERKTRAQVMRSLNAFNKPADQAPKGRF